jgi:formylglycine-generating enzyme required for sulfatase activity
MAEQVIYTVGGTVQAGRGIYIPRKADDELLAYCRASEFAFILSSRQVGKSSLMIRTARQLESENIRSVVIDLSGIGVKISADQWYLGILNVIAKTLKLKTDIFAWWAEGGGLGPVQKMTNFFFDILLKEVAEPVVLFFDEIDSTLSIPFADDFFAALRSVYNARSTTPEFKRLSFVMIGVATPSDLIADEKRTPFNIGHRVDLTDFTPKEAAPLAGALGVEVLGWIFHWTGGHPYLTQSLCAHLSKAPEEITETSVAEAVTQLFSGERGRQDNNLQFVRDMLTKRAPDIQRVLKTYRDVCSGKKVTDDERSIHKSHLKISGVVRNEKGGLLTRNRIYENVFNLSWINENMPIIYTLGGTVQAGGGTYIKRKADDELLEYCRASEFAFILSSRQVGKSSLMVRTARQLESEGIRSVIVDLSSIGVNISADEWYLRILNEIADTLELQADISGWWAERAALSPAMRLVNFLRDVLLEEVSQPVVLFFDEIDSTLRIPFADNFFAALRAIYNARPTVADFRRLSFVLIGVATPSDLISDSKRTPFNIGHLVELTDFTLEEAQQFAIGLGEDSEQILRWIYFWTSGHPYLTQKLCANLAQEGSVTQNSVESAVVTLFLGTRGQRDNNLQFVRDMLTKRAPDIQRVLKTFKDIRSGKKVTDDERSIPRAHLKISGVVRQESGNLVLRNRIYERAFDLSWIKENTPSTTMRTIVLSFAIAIALIFAGISAWQEWNRTDADRAYLLDAAFQIASTPEERLNTLAGMFALNGNEYSSRARNLFIGLPNEQKLELFNPASSNSVKRKQLAVALGVYQSFGFNPEVDEQGDEILAKIRDALSDDNSGRKLKLEISFWLEARKFMKTGEYDNAESKIREAVIHNPKNPALYYDLAQAYIGMENYNLALKQLNIMLDIDPSRKALARVMIEKNDALNQYWYDEGNKYPILAKAFIKPKVTKDNKGVSMVLIPEDAFMMGSNADFVDEKPLREVSLSSYYIDQYEVTNGAYKFCVDAGACQPPIYNFSSTRISYYGDSQFDNYPVIYVNWNMSNAYCKWRDARLPSEAEWEKAARGTERNIYPWGQDIDCTYANYFGGQNGSDCVGDTTQVGSYASGQSSYGVYDMAGNVWEWVDDWYSSDYYQSSPLSNPLGPASGQYRVLRGGSWSSNFYYVRSADRYRALPWDSYNLFGFRCARSLP